MIECSTENIWYKKRRKFILKKLSTFLMFIIILVALLLYYKFVITRQIYDICADYAYSYTTASVNNTVLNSFDLSINYSELIKIDKNSAGDIVLISADAQKINQINKKIAINTEKELKEKFKMGVPIPLFSFLGIDLLYGYGPIIIYKPISVVSVLCDFLSNFDSVGINQTLHSIFIKVDCEIKIQSLFNSKIVKCDNKVLICESVLVGKVPEIYLNNKLLG